MKNLGIWLDKEKAHLVAINNDNEEFLTIYSKVEDYHPKGGSGTRFKGGPQDVVQDSKYLEREKHQLKDYFKEITSNIDEVDAIAIYGPAETQQKFKKELETNYKSLNEKVKIVKVVDSMTNNQVKALVKDFFEVK
ncbi:hypothetical protein C7447_101878 [Tenacibaculum adriaticum]|uniref:Protein required for attachment to host cells n=1 Tax=Tenacibaculum adriaticum TaxID=413713 RepID=A0A5S5DWE4_9FLAO|nr:hypothetical protein [Tenacibaculum adriaticum]TYQ00268.1 hypothetical protein C7447_101878 [Tenacibaculum adriaticum]